MRLVNLKDTELAEGVILDMNGHAWRLLKFTSTLTQLSFFLFFCFFAENEQQQ